ncbi:transcriptional regulatory protein [Klebsiella pneumoniae]|nr:transcriptional regulatory protein [Klebsiella pneumoniae]
MSLTVSELLALEGLSALRLRAGKQGLQRAVRWYYVAENEHIAEWIMGGELVFITGINHPRDEANLIQLLMEGKQRGIAGMVILTGEAYIHAIPATLIALADELGMPLIEQPYLLKMVIVTERIGTALVRSENVLQSQRDILMQLVTGDYPDLQMLHQRALHQQLDFTRPLRLAALRLEGLSRLFRQFPPEQAEAWLLQAHRSVRQQLQQQLNQQGNSFPLLERSNMFLFLLPDEEGEGFQQKKMATAVAAGAGGRRGEFVAALRPLRAGQAAAGLPAGAVAGAPGAGSVRYPAANPAHQRLSAAGVYQTAVRGQRPGAAQRFYARHPWLPDRAGP